MNSFKNFAFWPSNFILLLFYPFKTIKLCKIFLLNKRIKSKQKSFNAFLLITSFLISSKDKLLEWKLVFLYSYLASSSKFHALSSLLPNKFFSCPQWTNWSNQINRNRLKMEEEGAFSEEVVCSWCSRWCFPSIVWQFSSTPNVLFSFCA